MYIYKRIKDLREDNDLLQKQVCTVIDCKQQQYQLYESGKREIPVHQAIKLAEYYKVSLDYLFGRSNNKNHNYNTELNEEENELLKKFRYLSENGKGKILERLEMIIEQEEENANIKDVI